MNYFIGADLGTSSLKLLLLDSLGRINKSVSRSYNVSMPQAGFSEQEPEDWWKAFCSGVKELVADICIDDIKGLGIGGQMHGLVILDERDEVIRPAILWNDGRTAAETDYLNKCIGEEKLASLTANIAFAGFTAPKLLWLKENEPENFKKIRKIMLPKDYLNYRLTGSFATDFSDASGMLLLDVKNKRWSGEMLSICEISEQQLPKLYESYEAIGIIKQDIARELGISSRVTVVAGAGDNAAAAVGTGTVSKNSCNISLGTSGTVFISYDEMPVISNNSIHTFSHADGGYHLMGCILSAASCNKWFCEEILKSNDFTLEQSNITDDMLGANHIYFLPYLMGERSPINDTDARGTFIGMRLDTSREQMLEAVLEGVAFAIRDCFEIVKAAGISVAESTVCGGGAKSPLWRKILANVLGITINIPKTEEGPSFGAAMLAMVGCREYASVKECAQKFSSIIETVEPQKEIVERYNKQYKKFKSIYPSLKDVFKELR